MNEISGFESAPNMFFDWSTNYKTPEGKARVDARQAVYWCLEPGLQPPDYDVIVADALASAGVPLDGTIVDGGCSHPGGFLGLLKLIGYSVDGLIGFEPHPEQFDGLPYWKKQTGNPTIEALKESKDPGKLQSFYLRDFGNGKEITGINLYEASADDIPLNDRSANAVTTIFSGYLAFRNRSALLEIKRILKTVEDFRGSDVKQRSGLHIDVGSGNENKEGMIADETNIAEVLSIITAKKILPPPPLQAGFTTEDAVETFPNLYNHVYIKRIEQEIIYNYGRAIILNSHMTYRDSYTVESSVVLPDVYRDTAYENKQVISYDIFKMAAELVVGSKIDAAQKIGKLVTDKTRRHVLVSCDEPVDLPIGEGEYEEIT